ncbi:MAG: N-acetylmuramoyl-L-alanine amidase [Syntrophomonadaceae bacterium]|nr:N-acetylmuramoyl-L-alanine amidase [Syntrophomonadaceae bacterium]
MFKKVLIIKRKPGSIILAILLLPALCYWGAGLSNPDDRAVMSYSLVNHVIVVDAGHGGYDPGAIGPGKHVEKDITLAISTKLSSLLSQSGALVINTREKDEDLAGDNFSGSLLERKRKDLAARVAKAQENHAEIFISIHTNADVSPRWSGAQTFYSPKSEKAKKTAIAIQDELIQILGNTTRQAKTGSYYITEKTDMTAVIVEVGFLSNPKEEQLLANEEYQDKVAYAIFSGIAKSLIDG